MKVEDLRQKSDDELNQEVLDLKKEAFNLRFQRASGQLENTARMLLLCILLVPLPFPHPHISPFIRQHPSH